MIFLISAYICTHTYICLFSAPHMYMFKTDHLGLGNFSCSSSLEKNQTLSISVNTDSHSSSSEGESSPPHWHANCNYHCNDFV